MKNEKQEHNETQQGLEDFEEVSNDFKPWKPSKSGEEIIGTISRKIKGNFGFSYVLETEQGDVIMPNHAILMSLLDRCNINDTVKIVYLGTQKSKDKGKNDTKTYKLYVKKA